MDRDGDSGATPKVPTRRGEWLTTVHVIEDRITQAPLDEAEGWVRLRGEIIRQDESRADRKHVRRGQMLGLVAKVGLSYSGLIVGSGLVLSGFAAPGLFCLGAGLYPLAPDYVKNTIKLMLGGRDSE